MNDDQFSPRKSLGQHWLVDEASLKSIASAADIARTDTILEIGPGPGGLTKYLVQKAKQVIAVELDENLADRLAQNLKADNLTIIKEDILKFDLSKIDPGYKIVANIPYYLTNHLIRLISEAPNPPTLAVLLIQKEVAERVTANPGAMSILSVVAQYYWNVELGVFVPASSFDPPPKVDSQVLILKRKPKEELNSPDVDKLFRVVKAGFSQKRKTLLNSLSAGLGLTKTEVSESLITAGIEPSWRAQTLNLEAWVALQKVLADKL